MGRTHQPWLQRTILMITALLAGAISLHGQTFEEGQLRFARVQQARAEKDSTLKAFTSEKGLAYPVQSVFMRAFKRERILEIWGRNRATDRFVFLKSYPLAGFSGTLGPKRMEGDLQIPEGFYEIRGENSFNPLSDYHLSMLVDYPNESDRKLGVQSKLGGEICVHGKNVTIGCLPITDDGIKEVYWLAVQAASRGQDRIPIHIFPARLDSATMVALEQEYAGVKDTTGHELVPFWRNLQPGYAWFEQHRALPKVRVGADGGYRVER
jgi:murein L,D-transpeptidase YafK